MSAVIRKANSGPLVAIPVDAAEPIVMNEAVSPVSCFIVSGISAEGGYPTDTTALG
jgi:hypothetical protein